MCWSENTSWVAFILGSLINFYFLQEYLSSKNDLLIAISFLWQWILLMQLFEAFIWKNQSCGNTNKNVSRLAYLANITQPILTFFALFLVVQNKSELQKGLSIALIMFYILAIMKITSSPECTLAREGNLHYSWWDGSKYSGPLYVLTLSLLFLILGYNNSLLMYHLLFILLALFLSMKFYKNAVASVWCFFVVIGPLFTNILSSKLT